jgi:hypothetical protein
MAALSKRPFILIDRGTSLSSPTETLTQPHDTVAFSMPIQRGITSKMLYHSCKLLRDKQ